MRIQHAGAAGAKHVPGEVKQAKPRGVQEDGNHPLFVETGALRKIQQVDAVEFVVLALTDQPRNGVRDGRIGGLLQNGMLGLDVAHDFTLDGIAQPPNNPPQRDVTANIGERSGWVVTTPTGITGSLSSSSMRNAPINFANARVASTSAKCAPMQTRAPTPNGTYAKRSGYGAGRLQRECINAWG